MTMHRSKLAAVFISMTLAACATDGAPDETSDGVGGGGKGDSSEVSNQLTLARGGTTSTLALQSAAECSIKEFTIIANWPNKDQSDYSIATWRLGLTFNNGFVPQAGESFELETEDAHNGFVGALDATAGKGCVVEIDSYENRGEGSTSHIGVSYENCDLGSGATVSGHVECTGKGFARIYGE